MKRILESKRCRLVLCLLFVATMLVGTKVSNAQATPAESGVADSQDQTKAEHFRLNELIGATNQLITPIARGIVAPSLQWFTANWGESLFKQTYSMFNELYGSRLEAARNMVSSPRAETKTPVQSLLKSRSGDNAGAARYRSTSFVEQQLCSRGNSVLSNAVENSVLGSPRECSADTPPENLLPTPEIDAMWKFDLAEIPSFESGGEAQANECSANDFARQPFLRTNGTLAGGSEFT